MARQVNPKAVKERIKANKAIMQNTSRVVNDAMKAAKKAEDFNAREVRAELSDFLKAAQAVSVDSQLLTKLEAQQSGE